MLILREQFVFVSLLIEEGEGDTEGEKEGKQEVEKKMRK